MSAQGARAAVNSKDGFVNPSAIDLVVGAGSSRAGCCGRDHGVLRSQSPRWRCSGSDASYGTGQPRTSRWHRRVRARASPSFGCRRRSFICFHGCGCVCQGQRCQQAQMQCLRFLLVVGRSGQINQSGLEAASIVKARVPSLDIERDYAVLRQMVALADLTRKGFAAHGDQLGREPRNLRRRRRGVAPVLRQQMRRGRAVDRG